MFKEKEIVYLKRKRKERKYSILAMFLKKIDKEHSLFKVVVDNSSVVELVLPNDKIIKLA